MGLLTDWLENLKVVGLNRHTLFPFLSVPTGWTWRGHTACQTCPQDGKPGHVGYGCGQMTEALPVPNRANLWSFMSAQYMLHRIAGDLAPPYGSQPGFAYYGGASVSFADQYTFNVTAAVGNLVTIDAQGGDLRAIGIYAEMRMNWGVPGRTFIPFMGCAPQSNDRAVPGSGCILHNKVMGRVRKVTLLTISTAQVEVDQDMSGLMTDNRDDQTSTFVPVITFVRQAGRMEYWTEVVDPSEMKCERHIVTVLAEDFPDGGRFELLRKDGTSGRAADPVLADVEAGITGTLQVWKKQLDPEPTEEVPEPEPSPVEDITGACVARFKRPSILGIDGKPLPGADGRGAYQTFLCLGTENWDGTVAFESLIDEDTEWVKVLYMPEVPDSYAGTGACVPCGRRCAKSVRDRSGSFYMMDDGEAHLANGEEWVCRLRRWRTVVESDDGRWEAEDHKVSHPHMYTADCSLYGICDGYEPIHTAGPGVRPFTLEDGSRILCEVTMGQNIALVQISPGFPYYTVNRAGRPTIHGLTSGVPMSNPPDWSQNIEWPQNGPLIVGSFDTKPHPSEDGDIMDPLTGGAWDGRVSFGSLTFPDMPPPGMFPTLIPNWTTGKMDALRRAWSDGRDPTHSMRYYEDDAGFRAGRIMQDGRASGFGRGFSQAVRKIGAAETFLLEKLALHASMAEQEQVRKDATFKWFEEDQDGPFGFSYAWMITWKNLLPAGGSPKGTIITAEIAAAIMDGTTCMLTLKNQPATWSRLKNEGFFNSWNEIFNFNCGGRIVRPADPWQFRSSETEENSWGGTQDFVTVGDCAKIGHTAAGFSEFEQALFTVDSARAYAGDKATDFGPGTKIVGTTLVNGYYEIPDADLIVPDTGLKGEVIVPFATLIADVLAADVMIDLVETPPFAVGQWLQVEDSTEVMQVYSVDVPNLRIYVYRGVHVSHPAADIEAGKKLTVIQVYQPSAGVIFEGTSSNTKPSDIDPANFWYDTDAARFYWSGDDLDKVVDIAFYVSPGFGQNNPALSFIKTGHTIFNLTVDSELYLYPLFHTDLTATQFAGSGTPPTKVFLDGSESTETGFFPPALDLYYKAVDTAGHVVLVFDRKHSGKDVRIELSPETGVANPFNLDIADTPEFATGEQWGLKMDVVGLADENGWLASQVALLPGKQITFERHTQKLSPDSEVTAVRFTPFTVDDYTEATVEGNILLERGRAILYGKRTVLNQMLDQFPEDPEPEDPENPPEIEKFICLEIK